MLRNLFFSICAAAVFFLTACKDENSLVYQSADQIYFFYQESCPHCHTAAKYIKQTYPNLAIKGYDIKMPGNQRLMMQAVNDYKLKTNEVGTPLICMGKNYIMGWNEEKQNEFDKLAPSYIKVENETKSE